MDALAGILEWFPDFTKGDLPSWLAVAIAVIAVWFATRKPQAHSELSLSRFHFDDEGGPISLDLELTTYSHAPRLNASATLKLDGHSHSMKLEPINTPQNYAYATVNTFKLQFVGQYEKGETVPKAASIDVKVRMSDGSKARYREKKLELVPSPPASQSETDSNAP